MIKLLKFSLPLAFAFIMIFVSVSFAADKSCFDSNGTLQTYCKLDSRGDVGIPTQSFETTAKNVVNVLGLIAGILSVIFLIMGGINYMSSEGDPAKLKGAKSTITYAVIGLAVSILAPLIVGFVLQYGPK